MLKFIQYKDPNSPELIRELETIPKCPGTCFFIDIVGSTMIKYRSTLKEWGRKLNNTFNFISFLNDFPDNIVKGIGDEIMLYIPDEELFKKKAHKDYFSLLQEIYATLDNIKNFPLDDTFLQCKVAIHYCSDVYNISFLEGANDYYGRDIDLAARLTSKAKTNRIVLSETFYKKAKYDFGKSYSAIEYTAFHKISEKYIEDFKGVPHPTEFRIIEV